MLSIEITLLIAALLLFVCVAASKVSDKLGVPVLLLFLSIGMLAGSEGFGGIYFNDPWIAKSLGTVALVFILFSGGFETHWADVRSIIKPGLILTSMMKRGDEAVFDSIKLMKEGKFEAGFFRYGLKAKGVDYALDQHNAALVSESDKKTLEGLRADIISGKIKVPDYYVTQKKNERN